MKTQANKIAASTMRCGTNVYEKFQPKLQASKDMQTNLYFGESLGKWNFFE